MVGRMKGGGAAAAQAAVRQWDVLATSVRLRGCGRAWWGGRQWGDGEPLHGGAEQARR